MSSDLKVIMHTPPPQLKSCRSNPLYSSNPLLCLIHGLDNLPNNKEAVMNWISDLSSSLKPAKVVPRQIIHHFNK